MYIEYLKTLGFQAVKERTAPAGATSGHQPQMSSFPGSQTSRAKSPPDPSLAVQIQLSSLHLYKCVQYSWIMLVELLFQDNKFVVQLYTLEMHHTRNHANIICPEIQRLFSAECAHFKDHIHLNSFMYDFHLRFLLDLLNQTRHLPKNLAIDIRKYVELIYKHNKPVPKFVRNMLSKGTYLRFQNCIYSLFLSAGKVTIPSPMNPVDLYHYLLTHSSLFGIQTIELQVGGAATSDLRPETIGLLINVSPQSLGPTATSELSKIIEETQVKHTKSFCH